MQQVLVWLTSRVYRAGLGIAVLFPFLFLFSAALVVTVALKRGWQDAAFATGIALLLIAAAAVFGGSDVVAMAWFATQALGIALLLSAALIKVRSLTLTVQMSVLLALAGVAVIFAVLGDPASFWRSSIAEAARSFSAGQPGIGSEELVEMIAPMMTGVAVGVGWMASVLVLFIGNAGYQMLTGGNGGFGQFYDLSMGRVLAIAALLAGVLALISGAPWLINSVLLMVIVFWVQGLALLHWLVRRMALPVWVMIVVYALMLFPTLLQGFVILTLSACGYVDAWADLRRRMARN